MVRGTLAGMKPGTILGHEGVGVVEEVGPDAPESEGGRPGRHPLDGRVRLLRLLPGPGYYAQCDRTPTQTGRQPARRSSGGPEGTGPIDGLQAEYARIPHAAASLVELARPPLRTSRQSYLATSSRLPGYFGAELAEISDGDSVAVFGCGPVGQFAIISAFMMGMGLVFTVSD